MTHLLSTQPRSLSKLISTLTIAVAIGGTALLVVDAASAHPLGHGRMDSADAEKKMEMYVERMAKAVDATPEQKTKLHAIAKAAQNDIKPLREQVRTRMDKALAEAKEVLTPEQQTKLDAKMKSMHGRMDKRMADRGERTDKK
jgi:Spy/CpxP family protein refolding chaperone